MRPFLLAAALTSLAFLGLPATEALPANPTIFAVGFQYAPNVLVVPLGTPVTITSAGGLHTWTTANSLTAANVGSPNDPEDTDCVVGEEPGEDANPDTCHIELTDGTSHTHVFQRSGTFAFYCEIHTFFKMIGAIQVV